MKRTIITALVALAAGLAQTVDAQEKLPLIAGLVEPVNEARTEAVQIELFDTPLEKSLCKGAPGGRMVRVVGTNSAIYPRVVPHSHGCWRVAGDRIVLVTWTIGEKREIATSRPIERFVKTPLFVSWDPVTR
jgi:hypothetical protein